MGSQFPPELTSSIIGVIVGFSLSQCTDILRNKRKHDSIKKAVATELEVINETLSAAKDNSRVPSEKFPFITETYDSTKIELASFLDPNSLAVVQRAYQTIRKLNLPIEESPIGYLQTIDSSDYIYINQVIDQVLQHTQKALIAMGTDRKSLLYFVKRTMADFSPVFVAFTTISLASLVGNIFVPQEMLTILAASRNTPWGVITSIFINIDINTSLSNIMGLILYLMFFCCANSFLTSMEKRKRGILLSILVFFSAILSNIIWIVQFPQAPAMGTSGVVYAAAGIILLFALVNLFAVKQLKESSIALRILWAFNPLTIIFVLYDVAYQALGARSLLTEGVNVVVHYYTFVISFVFTIIWIWMRVVRTSRKVV